MRVGIIGTGKHGSRYANHVVHDVPGLTLAAISRRSPALKDQAAQWNCQGHEDWRQLVADDQVEAVIGVVPPALNLKIVQACICAGKPLLLEKPLAATVGDARTIVSLCRKNKLPLTVGQTLRYNKVIQVFRSHLPQLGSLYSFSANQRLEPSTLSWHEQPELAGAGVSFHTAVHVFDSLRYITGLNIQRVMAVTGQHHNSVLEDMVLALVELEGGVKGTVDCSKVGQARSGRFEFVCENGQLVGDQVYNTCETIHHGQRTQLDPGSPTSTIVPLLQDWLHYVMGVGDNPISGDNGLKAVAACDACLRSARQGGWVSVDDALREGSG